MPRPAATRRSPLEGWYWRIVDADRGRIVVALCGVCRPRRGEPWAVVAVAAHPGGVVRWDVVDGAAGDPHGFGARAHPLLTGTDGELRTAVGDTSVEVALRDVRKTARASLGMAHAIPGLPQYWHAHVLDAGVSGSAVVAGERWELDGARAYAEKNWGPDFAADWWWGQAFLEDGVSVGFAGGSLGPIAPTAVVVQLDGDVHRLVAPLALVRAEIAPGAWRVRARNARTQVELEGEADDGRAHLLPVPDVQARRCDLRSRQHLAGRLKLVVREGSRVRFSGETALAGLERGLPPGGPPG